MRISDWSSDVCSSDLCALELARAHLVIVEPVAVLALQKGDRTAEIADVALDLGAQRNAPARHVIARRVAEALRRAPDRLVDPIAPLTLVLERRVGVLKIARQRARAGGDGFEHSALMLGQHLLHLAAELVAVGDAQEDALDQLVAL